jgi:hypothetical protein
MVLTQKNIDEDSHLLSLYQIFFLKDLGHRSKINSERSS